MRVLPWPTGAGWPINGCMDASGLSSWCGARLRGEGFPGLPCLGNAVRWGLSAEQPACLSQGGTSLTQAFGLARRLSDNADRAASRAALGFRGETGIRQSQSASQTQRKDRLDCLREKAATTFWENCVPKPSERCARLYPCLLARGRRVLEFLGRRIPGRGPGPAPPPQPVRRVFQRRCVSPTVRRVPCTARGQYPSRGRMFA